MKKAIFVAGLLLAVSMAAGAQEPKANSICEGQQKRCTETCDLDKVLWFFKGEAHGNCMQQCDEQLDACLAEDLDVDRFEVILPRGAYEGRAVEEKPSLEEYEIEAGNN